MFNPLNAELNPICHLLALLESHPILHISRVRVKVWVTTLSVAKIIALNGRAMNKTGNVSTA